MPDIEKALIDFFEQVARKNESHWDRLRQEPCFIVEQERWCFTLPDLYHFLQHQNDIFNQIEYSQFRHMIYNSPVNQTVKSFGAEITIAENQGNVDKSTYAMVWSS